MIALLIATQLAAASPPAMAFEVRKTPAARETPNAFAIPAHCRRLIQKTDRLVPPRPVPPLDRRLGDMPPAYLEYALDRRVTGCPVPTYVGDQDRPIRSR